jgi:NAD+ diphosphatase
MTLAFIDNRLDRCANRRSDADWIAAQLSHPEARMVHINGEATRAEKGHLASDMPPAEALRDMPTIFLGIDDAGSPWFACKSDSSDRLVPLRSLAMENLVPAAELGIAAQARALVQWHERRGFCSNCGDRNRSMDGGYRRHCDGCGMDHFPRTDPVIIMVVRHGDRILLGRQAAWTPGMYSALAGFLEPGETIEDAARREIREEAGIAVGEVRYATSQPWPFPSSLMIGLIGEALSDRISLDDKELEDARWFPRDEVLQMLDRNHPQGLWATNPYAIAHRLVRMAVQVT